MGTASLADFLGQYGLDVLLFALGVLVSVLLWAFPHLKQKRLSYSLDAGGWINPVMPGVAVSFKNQAVSDPHFAKVRITNTGSTAVLADDFVDRRPITIGFQGCQLHADEPRKALGVSCEHPDLANYISIDGSGNLALSPCILNARDTLSATVLMDGCFDRTKLRLTGRILNGVVQPRAEYTTPRFLAYTGAVFFGVFVAAAVLGRSEFAAFMLVIAFYAGFGGLMMYGDRRKQRARKLGLDEPHPRHPSSGSRRLLTKR